MLSRIFVVLSLFATHGVLCAQEETVSPKQWRVMFLEYERDAGNFRLMNEEQQKMMGYRGARLSGLVNAWSPPAKIEHTKVYCAMAMSALWSMVEDMAKATMRGERAFEADRAVFAEHRAPCLAGLK